MKNYSLLLLLFCCALVFNGCSSDDDEPSREEMLQNKRWQITAMNVTIPFIGPQDVYAGFENCEKDNYVEFRDNGILVIDEGATKCNSSDPNQYSGTWTLAGDVLTLRGAGSAFGLPVNDLEVTITNLSNNRLDGKFSQTVSGFKVDGTVTLQTM